MPHGRETALQNVEQALLAPSLEDLGQEGSARRKNLDDERDRLFREAHDAKMVGLTVAGCGGRHVGQDRVGSSARQRSEQFLVRSRLAEILLQNDHAGDRIEGKNIERHDRASAFGGLNALCGDLAPAAWSRSEIDNHIAGLQKPIFVRDLFKLIGRATAIAVPLRSSHIRIVQLPLQPLPGGGRAAARLLQFDLKRPVPIWFLLGHEGMMGCGWRSQRAGA